MALFWMIIYMAQSEELCEQAIACIRQMWNPREFVSPLRIYRYFGGRDLPLAELRGGAVVTCINQLHYRIKTGDEALDKILCCTGAMIIDEAHRAVSAMYDGLLTRAETICGPGLFPICGLTATPGRAGLHAGDETVKLVSRFEAYLIKPDLGTEYTTDPLRYFRDRQYLAHAHHIVHRSGIDYTLTDSELAEMCDGEDMNIARDLPLGFRKRLADETQVMRPLTVGPLVAANFLWLRVSKGSLIKVEHNHYSVPTSLIGRMVSVHVCEWQLEVCYGRKLVVTLPRLVGPAHQHVNYRHVIDSLLRKPGGFRDYRYREALSPAWSSVRPGNGSAPGMPRVGPT